jgi:hypothetical protein
MSFFFKVFFYCTVKHLHFFRLAGLKTFQYLRIQPSDYVGFPYADLWKQRQSKRERERKKERERERKGRRKIAL